MKGISKQIQMKQKNRIWLLGSLRLEEISARNRKHEYKKRGVAGRKGRDEYKTDGNKIADRPKGKPVIIDVNANCNIRRAESEPCISDGTDEHRGACSIKR